MRKIGHAVDTKLLREDYNDYRDELSDSTAARAKAKRARDVYHFTNHVDTAILVARLGYLFDAPLSEFVKTLRAGLPELVVALELGATLSPIAMRDYLGSALLTADPAVIKWFAALPRSTYEDSGIIVSEAAFLLIEAVQAGMRRDLKEFKKKTAKFIAALETGKLIAAPASEKAIYGPLGALLQAIGANDQAAFDQAWRAQEASWKKRFGRAAERANMNGLLDLEALGLARLAQQWGLEVPDTNPYAPVALLEPGADVER
jgi:immunity protein 49 of polymorphic toxin system